MSWLRKILVTTTLLGLLSACGGNSSETNGIPTVTDPLPTGTTPIDTTTPSPKAGIPSMPGGFAMLLVDNTAYTGLQDIAAPDYIRPPLVGNPLIQLSVSAGRSTSKLEGDFMIGVEDVLGFWWAIIPYTPNVGTRGANALDMVFSDNLISVRVLKTLSMTGSQYEYKVYYRRRMTGETQCLPVGVTGCTEIPWSDGWRMACTNAVNACRNYMNQVSSPQVHELGTVPNVDDNKWFTLTGGQS